MAAAAEAAIFANSQALVAENGEEVFKEEEEEEEEGRKIER
jgi:hypothetical protein